MIKKLLTVLFTLFHLVLSSQNPIVLEEYFENYDGQWRKVSIVERAYQQGNLTNEKRLYYENAINDWITQQETFFDKNGKEIRSVQQYFISPNQGFFTNETIQTYDTKGQLVAIEYFSKNNKDSPTILNRKTTIDYLEDCSTLSTYYNREESSGQLIFGIKILRIYDDRCEFVGEATSLQEDFPVEQLKTQFRVKYETLSNGKEQRIVEISTCPDTFDCQEWKLRDKKIYDETGRLIKHEFGTSDDYFRQISFIDYQLNQTVYTIQNFRKTIDSLDQVLFLRTINILDLDGKTLFSKTFAPFSSAEQKYQYNEEGLLEQIIFERLEKDTLGVEVFRDTTFYQYQLFCDGLLAEESVINGNYQTKTKYSYLSPTDCGEKIIIQNFTVFPNPTTNNISLKSTAFITGFYDIEIYDVKGRKIRTYPNVRSETQTLDVQDLPNGWYRLSILQGKERISRPFIINH